MPKAVLLAGLDAEDICHQNAPRMRTVPLSSIRSRLMDLDTPRRRFAAGGDR